MKLGEGQGSRREAWPPDGGQGGFKPIVGKLGPMGQI